MIMWSGQAHGVLADLGYEGERAALTTPIKKTSDGALTADQRTVNLLHAATRGPAERGNVLLGRWRALDRVTVGPSASAPSPPPRSSRPHSTAEPGEKTSPGRCVGSLATIPSRRRPPGPLRA